MCCMLPRGAAGMIESLLDCFEGVYAACAARTRAFATSLYCMIAPCTMCGITASRGASVRLRTSPSPFRRPSWVRSTWTYLPSAHTPPARMQLGTVLTNHMQVRVAARSARRVHVTKSPPRSRRVGGAARHRPVVAGVGRGELPAPYRTAPSLAPLSAHTTAAGHACNLL